MNEWGKVKKVVVGTATGAKPYSHDVDSRCINFADRPIDEKIAKFTYPQSVIDEANEDLENLANIYKEFGAEVIRPKLNPKNTRTHYDYCPRDSITTIHDKIIAAPMSLNERKDEWKNICSVTHDLTKQIFDLNDYVTDCIQNPNLLATQNYKPMWDAANILRAGRNILYLLSNTGNLAGAVQLQTILGEKTEFKVHVLKDVYTFSHIDSTIALLKPGKALINTARLRDKEQLPKPMQNWDLIEAPDPVPMPFWGDEPGMSQHTHCNCVSLDENTLIVQATQIPTIKKLEKHGFTVVPIHMRHQRTLSGGPHCCTLELEREYELDWFFDKV